MLREAMVRRMYRRSLAEGQITVPAVPVMIDEYVQLCANLCATLGVPCTPEQSMQLRRVLEAELAKAFKASQRSDVAISFQLPFGFGLNYRVKAEWRTVEADYDNWVATRPPPLFGTEPDARVLALACQAANPTSYRVLDIGAGTGRNALALARRGHPVDAIEMARKGYTPDNAARELGQQCNTMIFTRDEVTGGAAQLPLELIADDSAYEYEKTHLPEGAWPPTGWFEGWASGLDVFDVAREESPIELRWLVYQKSG